MRSLVSNADGDLDGYVTHWDSEQCAAAQVQPVWEAISTRMRAMLPHACAELQRALESAVIVVAFV